MATTSKRFGLTNKILSLLHFIGFDISFDLSDNESIEDYQPQASSDNVDENSTDKSSTETTTMKSMSGIE